MKIFFLIFFLIFSSLSISAITLDTDNFSGYSADGWSRDDGTSSYLRLDKDKSSYKTYDFSSSYANAEVTVTIDFWLGEDWESSDDFDIYFHNSRVARYNGVNDNWTYFSETFTTNLDSSGELEIDFSTDTSSSSERLYVDTVTIEYTETIPTITPETFTVYNQEPTGTVVGTINFTGSPDTFTILSGNTNNTFSVTNTGDITVTSGSSLENNTTSTFTLEINASNANGYDVENFTINLTDDIELSDEDVNTREFTNVSISGSDSVTINGSILQIGNQLLCKNTSNGGTCVDPTSSGNTQNNYHTQYYAKIDTSSGAPSNNSMAKLVFENGDEVVFARLYWSARIENVQSDDKTNAKTIQIKGPNASSYTSYTSPNAKYNWHDSSSGFDYAASQDVTEYISAQGEGEYYVGGITTSSGETGIYASWQLVVVVENSSRSLKNLSIFDGFYSVFSGGSSYPTSVEVNASGFITPDGVNPFNANLFIYMGESDSGFDDSVELLKKDGDPDVDGDWNTLVDGAADASDVVNASVYSLDYTDGYRSNDVGMAYPNFKNVLGVDIDKLPINIEEDSSQQFLSNSQTSTSIRITSAGDRFSLNMFALETEVFIPEFCYDYAYSQQEQFFTEDNDGTKDPELIGEVIEGNNDEIEVSIFIKSLVESTYSVDNMSVDISDINTTQASYVSDSTRVALVGDLTADTVSVTSGTSVADGLGYINNIALGSLSNNDYFYIFYKLDPSVTTMDMPLTVHASYDLTLNDSTVEYTLKLSEDIPLCSNDNFSFLPPKGIFNVVHNNYYLNTSTDINNPNGTQYYNLPTQVVKREGNFKVISMNPDELDELEGKNTVAVAVEMIDIDAFHYTDASCKNINSSISDRVWVMLENNATSTQFTQSAIQSAIATGMTDISSSTDFYQQARKNAAFRTSYNSSDDNGSLIEFDLDYSNPDYPYTLKEIPTYDSLYCGQDMNNDDIVGNDLISGYCPLTPLNKAGVKQCMECIYGYQTKLICSRDNFSIRPEAFLLKLKDQDQKNTSSILKLADYTSGVTSTPVTTELELAAGYQYILEVNATNHLNNEASLGYQKNFTSGSSDILEYEWSPSGTVSGCNDLNSSTISFSTTQYGSAELNTSLGQVGEYRLHMEDTTWTTVDHNSLYMSHHDGADSGTYFINSFTADCTENTSSTQAVNNATLNGCNISSNHDSSGSSLKYRDYDVEFHPYLFDVTLTPKIGLNNTLATGLNNPFIYISNLTDNENMSLQLETKIIAQGENGSALTNYVEECFATTIDMNITKSATTNTDLEYFYNFQDYDSSGNKISLNEINATINKGSVNTANLSSSPSLTTSTNFFQKDMGGVLNTITRLNFLREADTVANPEKITFSKFTVSDSATLFNADLISNKTAEGFADINKSTTENLDIIHYYGRTHATRQRYQGNTSSPPVNLYYEAYCYLTTNGAVCDPSLLQNPSALQSSDDIRWYINPNHNYLKDGVVNSVIHKGGSGAGSDTVNTTDLGDTTTPATATLQYDESKGYPYKTTMTIDTSSWLLYNKYDASSTTNEFPIEFYNVGTGWSGEKETNTTTQNTGSIITNRRTMW